MGERERNEESQKRQAWADLFMEKFEERAIKHEPTRSDKHNALRVYTGILSGSILCLEGEFEKSVFRDMGINTVAYPFREWPPGKSYDETSQENDDQTDEMMIALIVALEEQERVQLSAKSTKIAHAMQRAFLLTGKMEWGSPVNVEENMQQRKAREFRQTKLEQMPTGWYRFMNHPDAIYPTMNDWQQRLFKASKVADLYVWSKSDAAPYDRCLVFDEEVACAYDGSKWDMGVYIKSAQMAIVGTHRIDLSHAPVSVPESR